MGLLSSITNAFWPSDHEGGENQVRQEIVSEAWDLSYTISVLKCHHLKCHHHYNYGHTIHN